MTIKKFKSYDFHQPKAKEYYPISPQIKRRTGISGIRVGVKKSK